MGGIEDTIREHFVSMIRIHNFSRDDVAEYIGMTRNSLDRKLKGSRKMSLTEMASIAEAIGLRLRVSFDKTGYDLTKRARTLLKDAARKAV